MKNGDELNLDAGQFKIVNQKTYENLMEEIEKELMTTFPRILKTLRRREEIGGRFMSSEQRRLLSRLDHLNTIKNSWPKNSTGT